MRKASCFLQICFLSMGFAADGRAEEPQAEVIHWWASSGEMAAVEVLSDGFAAEGGTWVDTAIGDPDVARATGINRIFDGEPPTAMQFNTGKQFDSLVSSGMLRSLDDLAEQQAWREKLPPLLVDAITRDGRFFGVPVNVHGDNWFWVNKSVLEKAGVDVPTSFGDLIEAGPALRKIGVTPLAMGAQPWQRRLLFNVVTLAEAGPDTYLAVLGDGDIETVRSEAFHRAAEIFTALRDLIDRENQVEAWNDATALVIDGKAAVQVMGDWAKADFKAAGLVLGEDYDCVVPSSHNGYMIGGDIFVFPKVDDREHGISQLKLASLMMSSDIQVAFNHIKGSLPARIDVDVSSMDLCAQRGADILQDEAKQIPSGHYLEQPDLNGAIDDLVSEFWDTPSMSIGEFIEAYIETLEYSR